MLAKSNHSTWYVTVSNAAVGFCKLGGESQILMDEQGGSRAGYQVFALRQVVEKAIEKACVT